MNKPQERTASILQRGEKGIVKGFTDEEMSVKLLEMGLLPGTEIILLNKAPLGNPLQFQIGPYSLALRKEEAATILLES